MSKPVDPDLLKEQIRKAQAEIDKLEAETAKTRLDMELALQKDHREADVAKLSLGEAEAKLILAKLTNEGTSIGVEREREKRQVELTSDHFFRTYYFDHEVSAETVRRCMARVQTWCRGVEPDEKIEIEIILNSPGGDVVNGLALYDFLESIKRQGHRVVTGALGMAASMGSILLQVGDVRYMGRGTVMLIHELSGIAWGKTSEIEDRMSLTKKLQERAIEIYSSRSGGKLTPEDVATGWKRKDWWLTSAECLEKGLIDEIR